MKNWFLLVILFLMPLFSWAETKLVLSPFGLEQRVESETNPVLEGRDTKNFALGLRYFRHLFSIEYSKFIRTSGNDTFNVESQFQDYVAWYRYNWIGHRQVRGVFGGGLGVYQEEVLTRFYSTEDKTSSSLKWTAATGLGIEFEPIEYVVFLYEARLISGQNLDPNPNPSFLARFSIQF